MAGGAIISPASLGHAADKAAQDNEILKQQGKAAEVRGAFKNKKSTAARGDEDEPCPTSRRPWSSRCQFSLAPRRRQLGRICFRLRSLAPV